MSDPIPAELWQRIKTFCSLGKTGQIVMDAKEGHILAWKITESGRIPAEPIDTEVKVVLK